MHAPESPGFFGKVPARGDFLARRVPPVLSAIWEAWLQSLTVAARDAAAEAWPEMWLTAPLWHVRLGDAVAPPNGAGGVLICSMDRVGRMFPFTLIGCCGAGAPDWSAGAEALILGALEDGFDPDALDAALVQLGPPPRLAPGSVAAEWGAAAVLRLSDPVAAPGPDQSVWWSRGSDRVAPVMLRCQGLPGPELAAAMVTGGALMAPVVCLADSTRP